MIDAGRSFSGNERNCCFLNVGGGSFANVSGGSGLDFPDDGRAIATTDWDHDGDLDLWISNRNGPRIRLMRNDTESENRFFSLLLKGNGNTVNRDAIGARVEVTVKEREKTRILIQTLRAGQGFLSQSSKWLNVGLGSKAELTAVLIRWPDGTTKTCRDIKAGRRYLVEQGDSEPQLIPSRQGKIILSPSVPKRAIPSGMARIPAVTLLQGPKLKLSHSNGSKAHVHLNQDHSLLINLWATWCTPCLQELTQLRDQAARLRKYGLDVIAVNVDAVSGKAAGSSEPSEILSKIGFPFPSTNATEPLVDLLQKLHNQIVGLNQPLPVPASFLIDPDGQISVIYKGPLEVEQLLADLNHSSGTLDDRLLRSAQVKGITIKHPAARLRARVHEALIHSRHGRNWQLAGDLLGAIYHYQIALKLNPDSTTTASRLARSHFGHAATLTSHDTEANAVFHYRKGLQHQPENKVASNNLAWLLATASDKNVRDPNEALRIAYQLNVDTGDKIPTVLDTLAAALASNGKFSAAVETAERALSVEKKESQNKLNSSLKNRLELYRAGKPYTETRAKGTK